ncbi:4Fe-4S binding protein [Geoalkalibacter halelectricus]|uniref:4Fe-4S binding protein n=2 Tax=Geoalkalibacter halelectricus TaxID=2847045 RepID=A0ABY5ZM30_9BACT|nr:4Fe-4S binding protein [Geoalkalibacter halelectricus]UWZ78784.1 4Fe-4S binding protein [Geoalkalibacter halelectricus]
MAIYHCHGSDPVYYINSDLCMGCEACVPACPIDAIEKVQ